MTDVPTSEAWNAMVEAMHAAWQQAQREDRWDDYSETIGGLLAAALTAITDEKCPDTDCRDGWIPWGSGSPWVEEGTDHCPNPAHTPRVAHLVVAEQMGQIERVDYVAWRDTPFNEDHAAYVYRFPAPVPIEEEK